VRKVRPIAYRVVDPPFFNAAVDLAKPVYLICRSSYSAYTRGDGQIRIRYLGGAARRAPVEFLDFLRYKGILIGGIAVDTEGLDKVIARMGYDLGMLYWALFQEVASLHFKWLEYQTLYHHNAERIELLNQAAPAFFAMLQEVGRDDVILQIARLTDQVQSSRRNDRKNLTVRALPDLIADFSIREAVGLRVQAAVDSSTTCQSWRNRRLAHRDLPLALSAFDSLKKVKPLDDMSRKIVTDAVESVQQVLVEICNQYQDSQLFFPRFGMAGGVDMLLSTLAEGVREQAVDDE
jgi:hypothetical protein